MAFWMRTVTRVSVALRTVAAVVPKSASLTFVPPESRLLPRMVTTVPTWPREGVMEWMAPSSRNVNPARKVMSAPDSVRRVMVTGPASAEEPARTTTRVSEVLTTVARTSPRST